VYLGDVPVPTTQEWLEPALRLGAAALAGGIIGWERQLRGRPAGLRTHMLVSLGAATVVLSLAGDKAAESRAVQGVATGIGFLCAGDILHQQRDGKEKVKGLTSAAALWVSAALGLAAAVGRWPLVAVSTAATLLTLTLVRGLETRSALAREPKANERLDDP
jgi:putative Mg2+ transporter-C (MgtC) family protein